VESKCGMWNRIGMWNRTDVEWWKEMWITDSEYKHANTEMAPTTKPTGSTVESFLWLKIKMNQILLKKIP
jgi:hypothetical protein